MRAVLSWGRNAGNDPAQAVAAINMGPAFHTSVSTVSTVWSVPVPEHITCNLTLSLTNITTSGV